MEELTPDEMHEKCLQNEEMTLTEREALSLAEYMANQGLDFDDISHLVFVIPEE